MQPSTLKAIGEWEVGKGFPTRVAKIIDGTKTI